MLSVFKFHSAFTQVRYLCAAKKMMSTKNVQVVVDQGTVVGLEESLPNGKQFYTFKGIPYAEPPVGKLRFQPPVPLERFETPILDCSIERSVCSQKDSISLEYVGSEDCLFLNVYTPIASPSSAKSKSLAVMVWIHGGAFMWGSGNSDFYSPDYLVQENVVVVTINYRLGPFGFLSLPEAGVHGNAGLKDQLQALKWVKQNISKFGGNPDNITLFGESAGGASVHLHVLSKNSKQYFHKAICQSGTSVMEWSMQSNLTEKSKKLGQLLGCKDDSQKKILDCLLQKTDPTEIITQSHKTITDDEKRRGLPILFKPSIEKESPGAIVTQSPLELLSRPNAIDIPVMIGYNSHEGIIMLLDSFMKLNAYDRDLARMIPRSVNLQTEDNECLKLAGKIREKYFDGKNISDNLESFIDLMGDYHFTIGAHLTAEVHARQQHRSPMYFYRFAFDGEFNFFKQMVAMKLQMKRNQLPGASHADEMFYLFNSNLLNVPSEENSPSLQMKKTMCKMWTNFAKYGDPTPSSEKSLDFKWNTVKPLANEHDIFNLDYLSIGDKIEMKTNPDLKRLEFWKNIFQKWNGGFLKPKL